MRKRKLPIVFASITLIANTLLPLTVVYAETVQDTNVKDSNNETEIPIEKETENNEDVVESRADLLVTETDEENNQLESNESDVISSETVDETEKIEHSEEEVFSLEANRDLAMEIMEQDLQNKRSRISLFSNSPHVDEFINDFSPLAVKYANANGLYPSVMLAQAALESGWGRSSLSRAPYHQLFGIKNSADFSGNTITVPTQEWIPDPSYAAGGYYITINGTFRVYESFEGSFRDQANFLQKSRYNNVLTINAPTYKDATKALQNAGYATDPDYAKKLNSIISSYNLSKFDGLPSISYSSHVQSYGWLNQVSAGEYSGTLGKAKRLEAFNVNISNFHGLGIEYSSYLEEIGWDSWKRNGTDTGTIGQNRRIEAIKMKLTGDQSESFDLYYRTHVESFGWLDWSKNGEVNGAEDILNKRIEAFEVRVVRKGDPAPGQTKSTFMLDNTSITYTSHVQSHGWLGYVPAGKISGTTNERKRMEALKINLQNYKVSGGIEYRTHAQTYGWLDWVKNNQITGTTGEEKRVEAIQIKLTGEIAKYYDVYYRTHAQTYGWLDWAKNGEPSGTEGKAYRLESIQIRLVRKGDKAPGRTTRPFVK